MASASTPLRQPLPSEDDLSSEDQAELGRACQEARAELAAGLLVEGVYVDADGVECFTGLNG